MAAAVTITRHAPTISGGAGRAIHVTNELMEHAIECGFTPTLLMAGEIDGGLIRYWMKGMSGGYAVIAVGNVSAAPVAESVDGAQDACYPIDTEREHSIVNVDSLQYGASAGFMLSRTMAPTGATQMLFHR